LKLEHYGIRGIANDWLKDYLNHRYQFVQINEICSDPLEVLCGVPQGSILGPQLFILYINDICNVSKLLKFVLFADDTNIFYSNTDIKSLTHIVNYELGKLCDWFMVNKLSLNIQKTNYMLFGNKTNINTDISFNENSIERVKVTKFLGVYIDENLNWKHQIKHITSKISKSIAIICKVRNIVDKNVLKVLYCSLILPYLNYCVAIWGNSYKTNLKSIVLLQKKIIRIICGVKKFDSTNVLFLGLKLLKFNDIIEFEILSIVYKAHNGLLPNNIQNYFSINTGENYHTRQKGKFKVKYARTNSKLMSISIRGIKLWNDLDRILTSCNTLLTFRNGLKNNIYKKYKNQYS
jgi:hypothetical protein